jgi:hypothetical protein
MPYPKRIYIVSESSAMDACCLKQTIHCPFYTTAHNDKHLFRPNNKPSANLYEQNPIQSIDDA